MLIIFKRDVYISSGCVWFDGTCMIWRHVYILMGFVYFDWICIFQRNVCFLTGSIVTENVYIFFLRNTYILTEYAILTWYLYYFVIFLSYFTIFHVFPLCVIHLEVACSVPVYAKRGYCVATQGRVCGAMFPVVTAMPVWSRGAVVTQRQRWWCARSLAGQYNVVVAAPSLNY